MDSHIDQILALKNVIIMQRKSIAKLKAQIKSTVDLYFEGCDADTFDDRMRELQQTLEN